MKMQAERNTYRDEGWQGRANGSISSAEMLNQEQAARFLNLQPRTLESWRQRRIGPRFVRYSKRCIRYSAQDLQAWVDSQSIDTESLDRE